MRALPRLQTLGQAGYSLTELIVVIAIFGVVALATIPNLVSFQRAAATRAGSQELVNIVNRARWLAISQRTMVCLVTTSYRVQLKTGGCAGTNWAGPGADSSGTFGLQNGMRVTTNPQVVFSPLGTAITTGSFTVENTADSSTMTVTVAASGHITVGP